MNKFFQRIAVVSLILLMTGMMHSSVYAEVCAYVMPQVADMTIYRITFAPEPSIEPWRVAPAYSSGTVAFNIYRAINLIHIFHTCGALRLWHLDTDEVEVMRFEDFRYYERKAIPSPSGKYLLVHCFGQPKGGHYFALFDSRSGRLLRLMPSGDCNTALPDACFSPDERYVYIACPSVVFRCPLEETAGNDVVYLDDPLRGGQFRAVRYIGEQLYVTTTFKDSSRENRLSSLVERISAQDGRSIVVEPTPGVLFDFLPDTQIHAFHDYQAGEIHVQYGDERTSHFFRTDTNVVLAALERDAEARDLIREHVAGKPQNPAIISFDYAAITPGEQYAVLGLTMSARTKGLFVLYDLKQRKWSRGLVVGDGAPGGSTLPLFSMQ